MNRGLLIWNVILTGLMIVGFLAISFVDNRITEVIDATLEYSDDMEKCLLDVERQLNDNFDLVERQLNDNFDLISEQTEQAINENREYIKELGDIVNQQSEALNETNREIEQVISLLKLLALL